MNNVKIEIEISEQYVKILSKWASVSRTLNEAKSLLSNFSELTKDIELSERIDICFSELETIEPALNNLHQMARMKLWNVKT